jgi:hypothetical protein
VSAGADDTEGLDERHRGAVEAIGQERTERRLFFRELAIAAFVAAAVALRVLLGG